MATFADKPNTGSGPMSGYEETCQIHQLFHFHQFPCVCAPIPLEPLMFCRFHQGLDGCQTVRKNTNVRTCVAISIFSIIQALITYSAWNIMVWSPRLKLCPILQPCLYTPAPEPLLVLDPSVYQARTLCCLPFTLVREHQILTTQ